jgi:hypothetical protein
MDERELRAKAAHYKRVAVLVSDETITEALLEFAAKYPNPPDRAPRHGERQRRYAVRG